MEVRERQLRALGKDEGWNDLVRPFIERRITHYQARILAGQSTDYKSDVAVLAELQGVLSNVDRLAAEVEQLRKDRKPESVR